MCKRENMQKSELELRMSSSEELRRDQCFGSVNARVPSVKTNIDQAYACNGEN